MNERILEQLQETLEKIRVAAGMTNATVLGRKVGMDSSKLHQCLLRVDALLSEYFGSGDPDDFEETVVMVTPEVFDLRQELAWAQLVVEVSHTKLVPEANIRGLIAVLKQAYLEKADA